MEKFIITRSELEKDYDFPMSQFPKYTSQLINSANQTAQGTRPKVVGQMSELFPEYRRTVQQPDIPSWVEWYQQRYPDAIETATDKIYAHMEKLKEAIQLIDRDLIHKWVEDLIYNKTYIGLYYQQVILSHMAKMKNAEWRLACPEEEAKGIDGFVGEIPYSVKPHTYAAMERLNENISVTMIIYKIKASGDLSIEICN